MWNRNSGEVAVDTKELFCREITPLPPSLLYDQRSDGELVVSEFQSLSCFPCSTLLTLLTKLVMRISLC